MANLSSAPGDHIRNIRKRLGLTLSTLSSRTGLAVSTLSKLEKGNASLSYDKLLLLSKGLGVDLAELLADAPGSPGAPSASGSGSGRRVIQRVGEGQTVETQSYHQVYLATELLNKRFTPLIAEMHARTLQEFKAEFGDLIRHPGEEFAYVLEGEIAFHSEHYAPVILRVGDSIFFDSGMGHAYLKAADGPCRLVVSCAPYGGTGEHVPQPFIEASHRKTVSAPSTSAAAKAPKRPVPSGGAAKR